MLYEVKQLDYCKSKFQGCYQCCAYRITPSVKCFYYFKKEKNRKKVLRIWLELIEEYG